MPTLQCDWDELVDDKSRPKGVAYEALRGAHGQAMNRVASARLLTILLVITMLSPFVQAEIDPRLTASPTAQEADADNPAEYTITVHNDGDDDMAVSLSTSAGLFWLQWLQFDHRTGIWQCRWRRI